MNRRTFLSSVAAAVPALAVNARTRPPQLDLSAFENGRPNLDSAPPATDALDRWSAGIRAADTTSDNIISIFDVIGEDFWTGEGITSKRVAGALRRIGSRAVEVHINSPGGDLFEGVSIFNILQQHPHKVTVKIMGLAASAASIIAMAGDEIQMGLGSFSFIHNGWVMAVGNRHDMIEIAEWLEPFDHAVRDIYVARTEQSKEDVEKWMDDETFMGSSLAIERGFADKLLDAKEIAEDEKATAQAQAFNAVRRAESVLTRKGGLSRTAARALITEIKGKPGAAPNATQDAGNDWIKAAQELSTTLNA